MLNRLRARVSSAVDRVRTARSSRASRSAPSIRRAASPDAGRQSGS
jgi:hypothetical protein